MTVLHRLTGHGMASGRATHFVEDLLSKMLTTKGIEAMKPPAARLEIPDLAAKGLYLVHQPSGAKAWALRSRIAGKPVKLTLGRWPSMGLAEARAAAVEARERIERGADPVAEKRAAKAAGAIPEAASRDTVKAVIEQFEKRHLRHTRSADQTMAFFRREIIGPWGDRAIQSITKRDCIDLLDAIVDRGSPVSANRTRAHLNTLLNWAVGRDIIERNPLDGVRPPAPEKTRERVLTDDEIRLVWGATGKMEYPFGPIIRLLLLTGARLREVAEMTRTELSESGTVWTLPASRSKNGDEHVVPLSSEASAIIKALPRIGGSGLLFTTTGATPVSGFTRASDRLRKLVAEAANKDRQAVEELVVIPAFTLHDLRRTAATGMAGLRFPPHVVEAVLNHRSGTRRGVASVYNRHDHLEEKREALTAWARHVIQLVEGKPSNVVPLRAGEV
jgi:integrase